jgi:hypothetical protein
MASTSVTPSAWRPISGRTYVEYNGNQVTQSDIDEATTFAASLVRACTTRVVLFLSRAVIDQPMATTTDMKSSSATVDCKSSLSSTSDATDVKSQTASSASVSTVKDDATELKLRAVKQPVNEDALTNFVYLHEDDFKSLSKSHTSQLMYLKIHDACKPNNSPMVFVAQARAGVEKGCIAANGAQRRSLLLSPGSSSVTEYLTCLRTDISEEAHEIVFGIAAPFIAVRIQCDESALVSEVQSSFAMHQLHVGQSLWYSRCDPVSVQLRVRSIHRLSKVKEGQVELAASGVLVPTRTILRFHIDSEKGLITPATGVPIAKKLLDTHKEFLGRQEDEMWAKMRENMIDFLKS